MQVSSDEQMLNLNLNSSNDKKVIRKRNRPDKKIFLYFHVMFFWFFLNQ